MSKQIKDAPAFDFYPERWLAGVQVMSDPEQLAYLRLLCHQWMMQGLPEDQATLKRLAGGKGVTEFVVGKFPLEPDGKRRNRRLEEIRKQQRERIAKSREKISKMNDARLAKMGLKGPLQDDLQEHHKNPLERVLTSSSPLTTHPLEESNIAGEPSAEVVEGIVNAYPRRDDPMECRRLVSLCLSNGEDAASMLSQVKQCADHIRKWPGGAANSMVPKARNFFAREEWRSPEAYASPPQSRGNGGGKTSPTAHQAKPPGLFGSSMGKYRTDKPQNRP